VVAVDYFTKWIEARPVATITSATESFSASKSSADSVSLENSQLITGSNLIAKTSESTLNPMAQSKGPTTKFSQP
jgi:hypothetical protein